MSAINHRSSVALLQEDFGLKQKTMKTSFITYFVQWENHLLYTTWTRYVLFKQNFFPKKQGSFKQANGQ